MESLLKLQRCFRDAVTKGDQTILNLLRDNNPKFPPEERVESYRYAIAARFEESLLEDFPLLAKALGEDNFKEILSRFLLEHPSRTYNLSEVGLDLPKYFENHPIENHPYAKILADFEVARLYADNCDENSAALPIENIGGEDLSSIRLVLDNSARLFSADWGLLTSPIVNTSFYVLIYEKDFTVHNMELSEEMFITLRNIIAGQGLPQASAHLNEDQAANVSTLFSELVRLEIVIGYERVQ